MKNGKETRPNGVVITKKFFEDGFYMYYVAGSRSGPWDYLRNARRDADGEFTEEIVFEDEVDP